MERRLEPYFFLALFLLSGVLAAVLFAPFLSALAIAVVFAVVFYPVHRFVLARISARRGLAALLTLLFIIIVVVVPLSVLGYLIFEQSQSFYRAASAGEINLGGMVAPLEALVRSYAPGISLSADIGSYAREAAGFITENIGGVFSGAAQALLGIFIGIIALYYFLKDGERFVGVLVRFSPLEDAYDRNIAQRLGQAINSIVRGSITIALIQGILAGIGFSIFGVPNPALWGSVTAISALIPGIGTALVMIPVISYLFLTAPLASALGMAAWAVAAVGTIDNILSPRLIGAGARIHPLLVLLSVLGGLALLGPAGFFIGPLVIALLYVLGDMYLTVFANPDLVRQHNG